jgi:hypothetical protein
VVRAFGPIAAGHAASVSVVVLLLGAAQLWIDASLLRLIGGGLLIAFGLYKLLVPLSHPRWVGMRVSSADLSVWSFLMSSAHGAGLMLMPLLLGLNSASAAHTAHAADLDIRVILDRAGGFALLDVAAVAVHTAAMFLVMGTIALVVYEKVGLAILRKAWFNLDRIWAGTLIVTGGVTVLL